VVGLLAYWTFDDPLQPFKDSSGGTRSTLLGSGVSQVRGRVGQQALYFTGSGCLKIDTSDAFTTATYSVSAWLNLDSKAGWRTALSHWDLDAAHTLWILFGLQDDFQFADHSGGATAAAPNTGLDTNKWYHVVSVRDTSVCELWIDGLKMVSLTGMTVPPGPGQGYLIMGAKNEQLDNAWHGAIDELRIYNRAITPMEIGQLAREGGTELSTIISSVADTDIAITVSNLDQLLEMPLAGSQNVNSGVLKAEVTVKGIVVTPTAIAFTYQHFYCQSIITTLQCSNATEPRSLRVMFLSSLIRVPQNPRKGYHYSFSQNMVNKQIYWRLSRIKD